MNRDGALADDDPGQVAMDHAGYRAAWAQGSIRVDIDPKGAYRYLAAQMLLPLVQLAALGTGVGIALLLHWFPGVLVIIAAFLLPRLSRASAPAFMLKRSLEDPAVYDDLVRHGILRVVQRSQT
jgi:hypothetical protein